MMLQPADFSWPVESVLKSDNKGMVQENRYQLSFSIKPMLFAETADSTNVAGITVRMIRDQMGYYYLVAPKFKNVYVFMAAEGGLKLETITLEKFMDLKLQTDAFPVDAALFILQEENGVVTGITQQYLP